MRAPCFGLTEIMYPIPSAKNEPLNEGELLAKSICASCRLRKGCLESNIDELYGIWGGTTPNERAAMRKVPVGT